MMHVKSIAIWIAKIAGCLLQKMGRGGSFPGQLALKIYPNILKTLKYQAKVIVVTGTNGKTSTANMIASALKEANKQVVHNQKGDNLRYGIASALLLNATMSGIVQCDMIVLEVDELSMPFIMNHVNVDYVVITNFFRDQLDRSLEMEQLIQTVEKSLVSFHKDLILNGNDPNTVRFAYSIKRAIPHFYTVEQAEENQHEEVHDGVFCPVCGNPLLYDKQFYSHIGEFHCNHCDFGYAQQSHFAYGVEKQIFQYMRERYEAPVDAMYMIFNCMAVLTLFDVLGLSKQNVKRAFARFQMPVGRNEHFIYKQSLITLNLIKNPAGTNEVLKQIQKYEQPKVVLFLLNDFPQDGTDVSWIYDSDFEYVFNNTTSIITTGSRAYEAALRMKYGGYIGNIVVDDNLEGALQKAMANNLNVYVLTTYTGLLKVRKAIAKVIK